MPAIPANPEELTADWLNDALGNAAAFENSRIASAHAQILGGIKGFSGQLARLFISYREGGVNAPRTLIAKCAALERESREIYHAFGFYEREIRFYRELAGRTQLRVPRCHYVDFNPGTGRFILLLEDLAPARNGERAAGCSLAEAEPAIREIAGLHAGWWGNPQLTGKAWLSSFSSPAVMQLQKDMYLRSVQPFTEIMSGRLPTEFLRLAERFSDRIADVYRKFFEQPRTLVHNDYMLDNIFFFNEGNSTSLALIDWQFVVAGNGMLDVASFLGGNISTGLRREHELDLLKMYHSILVKSGVDGYPFDRCYDDYRFAMFDGVLRMVIAIGGLGMRDEQKAAHRDRICPRFCAAALDLEVGELLPG